MKNLFNLLTISVILLIAVNFSYAQNPVSGYVLYSDNLQPVTSGTVNAYDASNYNLLNSVQINPDGSYNFDGLPGIQIDVIGVPNWEPEMEGAFAPTYYPNKIDFLNATQITPNEPLNNINIFVQRINGGIGSAFGAPISGTVTLKKDALKDAIIYAQQGDDIRGYAITDARGNFKIKNLPLGDYILVVHRIGCTNSSINVTLTSKGLADINFSLENAKKAGLMKSEYKLNQNYPNPFNPKTQIVYSIPKDGSVKLDIYSINGQLVKELVNEFKTSGDYKVEFDGSNLASGIYFYTLRTGNFVDTKKLTLIK